MSLHLITGYAGKEHITSFDQGSFNIAMMGNDQVVLDRGNKFSASIISNNKIRILDGDILMQGRHIRQKENTYEELDFDNGAQGLKRNDLVVVRYSKDAITGVEDCSFVVIKGTAVEGTPADPEYIEGDITEAGNELQNDMPLCRVSFDGLAIQPLVPLFKTVGSWQNHSHSAEDIISGILPVSRGGTGATSLTNGNILLGNGTGAIKTTSTLPISKGGTGATSASTALSNLGMTILSGTWTPTLSAREGRAPTYTAEYWFSRYYRINNLVYVTFHMKVNITKAGTGYACIRGLPFTAANETGGYALAMYECFGGISYYPASAHVMDSSSAISIRNSGGEAAQQWKTGVLWIGFSGCYIKA